MAIVDLELKPDEIRDVKFYRRRKNGRIREFIVLETADAPIYLEKTAKTQFIKLLGLKLATIRENLDRANELLFDAIKRRQEPLIFRCTEGEKMMLAFAVVSPKYVVVRHGEIFQIVEDELKSMGYRVRSLGLLRTSRRVWKTYLLENLIIGENIGEPVAGGVRVANSVKGTSAVILYGFWQILVCDNGLMTNQGVWTRTIHLGSRDRIIAAIRANVVEVIRKLSGLEFYIERAKSIRITENDVNDVFETLGLSMRIRKMIRDRLDREDYTLWGLCQAFTWVASHERVSPDTQIRLEKYAYRLLTTFPRWSV